MDVGPQPLLSPNISKDIIFVVVGERCINVAEVLVANEASSNEILLQAVSFDKTFEEIQADILLVLDRLVYI